MNLRILLGLLLAACNAESRVAPPHASAPPTMPTSEETNPPSDTGSTEDPLIRTTIAGAVRGVVDGGSHAFLGIPYAEPPVGPRRFRAPEPPAPWDGVRDAVAFGEPCVQPARSFLDEDAPSD